MKLAEKNQGEDNNPVSRIKIWGGKAENLSKLTLCTEPIDSTIDLIYWPLLFSANIVEHY